MYTSDELVFAILCYAGTVRVQEYEVLPVALDCMRKGSI